VDTTFSFPSYQSTIKQRVLIITTGHYPHHGIAVKELFQLSHILLGPKGGLCQEAVFLSQQLRFRLLPHDQQIVKPSTTTTIASTVEGGVSATTVH
jgi:DTW domain-containing protein YfiP